MPTSFASIWQVLFRLIVFEIRSSTINRFGAISGSTHWSREENRAQGYAAQSPKIYSSGDQRKPLVRFIATNPALSSQASVPSAFFRLDVFQPAHAIGRAHVCTPVTNANLVSRLLLEQK